MRMHSNKPPVGQVPNWIVQNNRQISGMDTQEKVVENKKTGSPDKVDNLDNNRKHTDIIVLAGQLLKVRQARVQAIKESVAAGTYVVYPCKVAEKMLKWM
jgi:anti-sigma28 factor (negative regulator of flagellin synthesis)